MNNSWKNWALILLVGLNVVLIFFIGNSQTAPSSEARSGDGFEQGKSEGT